MIRYYGIGTWWKSTIPHQHFNEFIERDMASIHASLNKPTERERGNRQRFQNIFNGIEKEDIIYLKGYNIRGRKVRIRAVGRVIEKSERRDNDIFCISVYYGEEKSKLKIDGLIDLDNIDDSVPRDKRVYEETNLIFIEKIKELMKSV